MPWWITVPAGLAVVIAAGYGVLAVCLQPNRHRFAAALHARRIAVEAEISEQKTAARV